MTIREKILENAFEEIYKNGYEAASINKILENAKVNKGSMYHYFKSKKELALVMIRENVKEYIEKKYGSILNEKDNFIDKMLRVFNAKDDTVFYGCRLNNLVQELSHKDEDFKKELEIVYLRFEEIIENVLKKAIKNGEISHKNPKKLSIFIVASLEGCVATAKKSQNVKSYQNCIDELRVYLNTFS